MVRRLSLESVAEGTGAQSFSLFANKLEVLARKDHLPVPVYLDLPPRSLLDGDGDPMRHQDTSGIVQKPLTRPCVQAVPLVFECHRVQPSSRILGINPESKNSAKSTPLGTRSTVTSLTAACLGGAMLAPLCAAVMSFAARIVRTVGRKGLNRVRRWRYFRGVSKWAQRTCRASMVTVMQLGGPVDRPGVA